MSLVRRKCFISYHHADQDSVDSFIRNFDHGFDCFIARGLGQEMTNDIISSYNTDYVMRQIRERFLRDSTVTIVMLGRCTWSRRYVDWEIQSSLRQGAQTIPNGLLGVRLPSFRDNYPERFRQNLSDNWPLIDCYARHIDYPTNVHDLASAIDTVFERRTTHGHLIKNTGDRMINNRPC